MIMKRLSFAVILALASGSMAYSSVGTSMVSDSETTSTTETVANDYVDFFFNGLSFKIPQGMPVNMEGNEALVKSVDGSFGLSFKMEKDAKATPTGAYELCKRVVTDLHLQEAKLSKVNINGLEGACVEGKIEGMRVAVEVLDAGKRYLKAIAIFDDSHADAAKEALTAIKKN